MKVMVTGAGGLLAQSVLPALTAAHHEVHAFSHAQLDVGEAGPFVAKAHDLRPDWIFHLAAWARVDDCEADPERARRVNVAGSRHAAEAAKAAGGALLALSSDYVFDGAAAAPYHESDATAPINVYGTTKRDGELAIRESGVRHLIVRTAWLFGPGGGNFVDAILKKARAGGTLAIVDDQRGSPTYTPDLAAGLLKLVAGAENGTYHVVNSGDATWHDLARAAVNEAGLDTVVDRTTTAALGRPAPRPRYSVLDASKFAKSTAWNLPHWKDAVARHVRHGREAA